MKNPVIPAYLRTYTRLEMKSAATIGSVAARTLIVYCMMQSLIGCLDLREVSRPQIIMKILLDMAWMVRGYADNTSMEGKMTM